MPRSRCPDHARKYLFFKGFLYRSVIEEQDCCADWQLVAIVVIFVTCHLGGPQKLKWPKVII